jgi:membrane protein implicated in regulation of membrane protease activity
MNNTNDSWMAKSGVSRIIFILIILYSVTSINVMVMALGIVPFVQGMENNPLLLTWFAILSFVVTLIVSAYHLSTMLRSRKRSCDQPDGDEKPRKRAS